MRSSLMQLASGLKPHHRQDVEKRFFPEGTLTSLFFSVREIVRPQQSCMAGNILASALSFLCNVVICMAPKELAVFGLAV